MPAQTIEADFSMTFQVLLSVAHIMFPFLPKVDAIDYAVDRVIAEIGVDKLD